MASVVTSGIPRLSPMTLATLEDSGWYTANYSMTYQLAKGASSSCVARGMRRRAGFTWALKLCEAVMWSPAATWSPPVMLSLAGLQLLLCRLCGLPGRDWGYLQGCNFAQNKCLDSSRVSTGTPAHFCSTLYSANQPYCSLDRYVELTTGAATPCRSCIWLSCVRALESVCRAMSRVCLARLCAGARERVPCNATRVFGPADVVSLVCFSRL